MGKLLVNAGSVGPAFDGDQRASYALMKARGGKWEATPRRVAYDVAGAIEASRRSENPDQDRFARRLGRASDP